MGGGLVLQGGPVKMAHHVVSADGTSIAFESTETGPALVLVDAAGGFRGFGPLGSLAASLAADFAVFRYDRRGRGDSTDTQPYAVEREVEDLAAVIQAAGGSAFVYGFSSGAVLALHAAASGLPIPKLALLEPPLDEVTGDTPADPDPLEIEIAELVAAGRRGDAVEHFNRSIGVPEEYLVGMREAPWWPSLEALAHTLVYDCVVTRSLTPARLAAVTAPTLVITSEQSDERLGTWSKFVADALPNAALRSLPGEWHGVADDVLAPVLREFFSDER